MKAILEVGECMADHLSLKPLLDSLGAKVTRARTFEEAKDAMATSKFDLVLVNRVTDFDKTQGLLFIKELKQAKDTKDQKVMLVSNYPEAQESAVALGALHGFGKDSIGEHTTKKLLEEALK